MFFFNDQRSKDELCQAAMEMFAPLTCIYAYSESPLDNGIQYFWKIYVYIYMYTFVTFAFSDMCIEIIILEYKDLEFDFPQKDN